MGYIASKRIIVCSVCGDFAIASWNQFGKKIGTCYRHKELLFYKDDLRSVCNFDNGNSEWNWEHKWYLPHPYK